MTTPAPKAPRRVRPAVAVAAVVGIAAAGWWFWPARPRPEPPLPADIPDPEVRAAVDDARGKVLAGRRSAEAWGRLGMVYLANGFEPEADRSFEEAARLDPADPRWPYGRGRIALLRNPDAALDLLRRAADAGAGSAYGPSIRLQLAEALLERGQAAEAEPLFRAESGNPEHRHRAAYGLGLAALARGDRAAAAQHLAVAREKRVVRPHALAQLAALARAGGDAAAAARYEQEAAEAPPAGRWQDPFLNEVVDLQVGRVGFRERAEMLAADGRNAEAADLSLRSARARPTARGLTEAGFLLVRAGNLDRALPVLREAAALDPNDPVAQYNLALGLFVPAEQEHTRAPGVARALFEEVVRHASRAVELKPDYGMAYLLWGVSLKALGRPAEAVAPLRRGVAAKPEEFELQYALAEVLAATGAGAEARQYAENARRLDPNDPRPGRLLPTLP